MVGLDDFGALGTSLLAAAEEGNPDCSCATEETEEGKKDEGGDDTNHDTSNGTSG